MVNEQEQMREDFRRIGEVMQRGTWRVESVVTFTHGLGVQVYARVAGGTGGRWHKVGPILFPPEGGSIGEVLTALADLADGQADIEGVTVQ